MLSSKSPFKQLYENVFQTMILVAVGSYAAYCVLFWILNVPGLPLANALVASVCVFAWWLQRRQWFLVSLTLVALLVLAHSLYATSVMGWSANFHQFGFTVLIFLLLCPYFTRVLKLGICVTLTLGYLIFESLFRGLESTIPPPTVLVFGRLNTLMICATVGLIAYFYATAIKRATEELDTANTELSRLATTDPLTGLFNRRHISTLLEEEVARFHRVKRRFSVIVADIDDFKAINDHDGHAAGDAVLVEVAQALRDSVRDQDRVARWGGEEFLVFLPETDAAIAASVVHRVQARLQRITGRTEVRMTFGIAEYYAGLTLPSLLSRADRALYQGKKSGKNRIELAGV